MTPKEYRLSCIPEGWRWFADRKIVLFGTGENTRAILELYRDRYCFAGLLDPGKTGQVCHGLPVLSEEEIVKEGVEVIVIAARPSSAEIVYEKISAFAEENRITLCSMAGQDMHAMHRDFSEQEYLYPEEWEALCLRYDRISFPVMETVLQKDLSWAECLSVRPLFRALYKTLKDAGKTVLFIASPDYPEALQRSALKDAGIDTEDCFFMQDWQEELFLFLVETGNPKPGEKRLHIGPELYWDCVEPRMSGWDTVRMVYDIGKRKPAAAAETGGAGENGTTEEENAAGDGAYTSAGIPKDLARRILEADVVSFDIFDTLLVRTIPDPEDFFELLSFRASEEGIDVPAKVRIEAQKLWQEDTLPELWERIREHLSLTEAERDRLLAMELSLEEQVLLPRKPVTELFYAALAAGKRLALTTDMYLTAEELTGLLEGAGITGYHKLFLSSEEGVRKQEGLFLRLRRWAGEDTKLLHIGDSVPCDVLPCSHAGIPCVRVKGQEELWQEAWHAFAGSAFSFSERTLIGLLSARYVSELCTAGDRESLRVFGLLAAAPVLAGYLSWLLTKAVRMDRMLFPSRDGFLPQKLYETVRELRPGVYPGSLYFYTSRRASFLPESAGEGTAEYFSFRGREKTPEALLKDVYDLPEKEIAPFDSAKDSPEARKEYILCHAGAIRRRAERARRNTFRYFRNAGLMIAEQYGFTELVAAGFTQFFLERTAPFELRGFYLGFRPEEQELKIHAEAYLPSRCMGRGSLLGRRFMELEYLLAAPHPSAAGYDDRGNPVFLSEERTKEELEILKEIQEEIFSLGEMYFRYYHRPGEVIRPELVLQLYERFGSPGQHFRFFDSWLNAQQSIDGEEDAPDRGY